MGGEGRRRRFRRDDAAPLFSAASPSDEEATTTSTPTTDAPPPPTTSSGEDDGGDEDEASILRRENECLRESLRLLRIRNDELTGGGRRRRDRGLAPPPPPPPRLIIEDFEGDFWVGDADDRGGDRDGDRGGGDDDGSRRRGPAGGRAPPAAAAAAMDGEDDYGTRDDDLDDSDGDGDGDDDDACVYDERADKWYSGTDECPMEPNVTFLDALRSRAAWLVGLLALQSCSGFVLSRNEDLLRDHPAIIYFLTMLVGAGGNAGNQASVRVIRGLALGTLNPNTRDRFLLRELRMAVALSAILSIAGFARAAAFRTPLPETAAVTLALGVIVLSSVCLGAVLPLGLQRIGVDPAHSSTTIQVVMDILGGERAQGARVLIDFLALFTRKRRRQRNGVHIQSRRAMPRLFDI